MRRAALPAISAAITTALLLSLTVSAAHAGPAGIPTVEVALDELAAIPVAEESHEDTYDRTLFPHWITVQGTCNTRETVLIRDGENVVTNSSCAAASGTRERLVRTTSRLMQRQGYEATGIKQISREAGVALSSVYHFFPSGKQELAAEAVRHADQEFADILEEALAGEDDPGEAMIACTRLLAIYLRDSDWLDGCPITATALETSGRVPDIQQAVLEAFVRWRGLIADKLRRAGIAEQDVLELAHTVINTLEGAELDAQVSRSEEPLKIAGRHLARLINSYRK